MKQDPVESQAVRKKMACPMCSHAISMDDDECPGCKTRFDRLPGNKTDVSGVGRMVSDFFSRIGLQIPGKSRSGSEEKLISFDEVSNKFSLKNQSYLGVKAIALSDIIGSLSRYNDFNRYFLPAKGFSTRKLDPILALMKKNRDLPPVTVYEVNGKYFIIDGHHRVSASLLLEKEFIDAEITQIDVDVPLLSEGEEVVSEGLKEFIIELERKSFQKKTYLYNNILSNPIIVTHVSSYGKLYEDILQQYRQNDDGSQETGLITSALEWYRHKYLPVISLIEDYGLLSRFARRTPADLYVWLLMHRYFLSEQTGSDIGFKTTISDFIQLKGKKAFFDNIPTRFDSYLRYILKER